METKFNSQICTSREQSERLLALGLKKETADCYYWQENDHIYGEATGVWHLETLDTEDTQEHFEYLDKYFGVCLAADEEHYFTPAWSLGRLVEMMPNTIHNKRILAYLTIMNDRVLYDTIKNETYSAFTNNNGLFAAVVDAVEWLIKEGYFNKKYLV